MNAVIIPLGVLVNFILYLCFGSLITRKKGHDISIPMSIGVGFFFYYFVFFFVCIIPMKYYRPLSLLTGIWVPIVIVVCILSAVLNGKRRAKEIGRIKDAVKNQPVVAVLVILLVVVQIILVATTYNFTLDAAYYVANVATSVETNMMNVYDPFTGAWLNHFEMRYFFATYSMQDAVVCQITGIPALIWTKSVMATTIIILTNIVYYLISNELLLKGDTGFEKSLIKREVAPVIMMAFMFLVNVTFITIYTSSLFLMTRTYEGKAIVGNLALIMIFYLFIKLNDETLDVRPWFLIFTVCFGATTISSSANMLVPVELTVLFLPLILRMKKWKYLWGYILCVLPGVILSLVFVLYVKGFFVFYTYPR